MVFGFFKKKPKPTAIVPAKSREQMQRELDEIDFQAAKSVREARLKRAKSVKRRETIKGIGSSLNEGFSLFDDSMLKDPVGGSPKTKAPKKARKPRKKDFFDDPLGDF